MQHFLAEQNFHDKLCIHSFFMKYICTKKIKLLKRLQKNPQSITKKIHLYGY